MLCDGESQGGTEVARKVMCQMCSKSERQYKCPKCSMVTCSLTCCKEHKVKFDCSGKRDRTAYVSCSQFKEDNMRNDFHFLEDVLQSKDTAKRTLAQAFGGPKKEVSFKQSRKKKSDSELPAMVTKSAQNLDTYTKGQRNLVAVAKERGVNLVLMPIGMSKRLGNKTSVGAQRQLLWKLHLVFVLGDGVEAAALLRPDLDSAAPAEQLFVASDAVVSTSVDGVLDTSTLAELLARFLDPTPGNSLQRHTLKCLRAHRDELECFVQRIPSPASNPLFCRLDVRGTLQEALRGHTVIEYPTLFFGWAPHMARLRTIVAAVTQPSPPTKTKAAGAKAKLPAMQPSPRRSDTSATLSVAVSSSHKADANVGGSGSSAAGRQMGLLALLDYASDADESPPADVEEGEILEDGEVEEEGGVPGGDEVAPVEAEAEEAAESSGDEEEDEEEFLSALQAMEGQDIHTLKAFIASEEQRLLGLVDEAEAAE